MIPSGRLNGYSVNTLRDVLVSSADADSTPSAPVLDAADEAHHGIHVNGPWCHGLCGFGIVGNAQGSLVCCFSWIDDGDDDSPGLSDGWNDAGWQLYDQYLFQLPEVLGAFEHRFSARYVLIYVLEKRVLWGVE